MKKMVCEICGSQKIRKENEFFSCLECGTEYSLEEAKNLLKEIDIDNKDKDQVEATIKSYSDDKYVLLKKLFLWRDYLECFQNLFDKLFEVDYFDNSFWNGSLSFEQFLKGCLLPTPNDYKDRLNNKSFIYKILLDAKLDYVTKKYVETKYDRIISLIFTDNMKKIFDQYELVKTIYKKSMNFHFDQYYGFCRTLNLYVYRTLYKVEPEKYYKAWCYETLQYVNANPEEFKSWFEKTGLFGKKKVYIDVGYDPKEAVQLGNKAWTEAISLYSTDYNNLYFIFQDIFSEYQSLIKELKNYENMFMLPLKYRRLDAINSLISIIYEGKAESWKESINLYDTMLFRNDALESFKQIKSSINDLKYTIEDKFNEISMKIEGITTTIKSIDNNLSKINYNVLSINNELKKNTFYNKLIMWSTL